ncbi:hypothetical protein ACJMK2_024764 [Sinanodonta woodiana]|uniref:Metalloendopeptidase n=1 Tax=Sinanodonta woodiana TaxID=1069815 RepID=A0ABD3XI95_SINWO
MTTTPLRVAGFLSFCVVQWCNGQNIPEVLQKDSVSPPNMLGQEPPTNKTMGQLVMDALGGLKDNLDVKNKNEDILMDMDMVLSKQQYYSLYLQSNRTRSKRKAIRSPIFRWPNGVIPYRFYPGHFDQRDQDMVRQAMMEWERNTCLRFREATPSDVNLIVFTDGPGCISMLGMVGGEQDVSLSSPGCRYRGLYLHEIGHAIGLVHEHNRPDRDEYVEIIWKNVQTNMLDHFTKYTSQEVDQMNVAYDYSSVMHYAVTDFSKGGGLKTMRVKYPANEDSIGNVYMKELSVTDIEIVNKMYSCLVGCQNKHENSIECDNWAVEGKCEADPLWMIPNCQKSCYACDKPSIPKKATTTPTPDIGCMNFLNDFVCDTLAARGECDENPSVILVMCRKSCGQCNTNTTNTPTTMNSTQRKCDPSIQCSVGYVDTNCQYICRNDSHRYQFGAGIHPSESGTHIWVIAVVAGLVVAVVIIVIVIIVRTRRFPRNEYEMPVNRNEYPVPVNITEYEVPVNRNEYEVPVNINEYEVPVN